MKLKRRGEDLQRTERDWKEDAGEIMKWRHDQRENQRQGISRRKMGIKFRKKGENQRKKGENPRERRREEENRSKTET